uniref:Uncharacterized protein n=1 Tax=Cacopsylla melanoneura TaxID=428564 RepID=A0A8D8Q9F7_9HEMI
MLLIPKLRRLATQYVLFTNWTCLYISVGLASSTKSAVLGELSDNLVGVLCGLLEACLLDEEASRFCLTWDFIALDEEESRGLTRLDFIALDEEASPAVTRLIFIA